jgi:hypothetical protein
MESIESGYAWSPVPSRHGIDMQINHCSCRQSSGNEAQRSKNYRLACSRSLLYADSKHRKGEELKSNREHDQGHNRFAIQQARYGTTDEPSDTKTSIEDAEGRAALFWRNGA